MTNHSPQPDSYSRTIQQFDTAKAARNYPDSFSASFRGRREADCMRRTLRQLPAGSSILDLPCGTGRLIPLLLEHGLKVHCADASPHMVELARRNWMEKIRDRYPRAADVNFSVQQAGRTTFKAGEFDAVICHRLFHHFNEPQTRIEVLRELARISRGPVIVSFFNSFALDAVRRSVVNKIKGIVPNDRIPIPMSELKQDIQSAGLNVQSTSAVMWGISPLWLVTMRGQRVAA